MSARTTTAKREIPPCPPSGEGVHTKWMMKAAWACRKNGMTREETCAELHARITRPPNPADEIEDAVDEVFDRKGRTVGKVYGPGPGNWPPPNREQFEAVATSGFGVPDLWECSPVRLDGDTPQTATVLPIMFPGDPLICAGATKFRFATERLSTIKNRTHRLALIVPSPMRAKYGKTKSGKKFSQHTLDATGPRRFIVIEGDKLDGVPIQKDTQAAVLRHLAEFAPLALVVDSGGKSLHGWFYCQGVDEAKLGRFFARAAVLGADTALWGRSQFARMPDGTRDTGERQSILYFNPEIIL
jgi:hypothetical protein